MNKLYIVKFFPKMQVKIWKD